MSQPVPHTAQRPQPSLLSPASSAQRHGPSGLGCSAMFTTGCYSFTWCFLASLVLMNKGRASLPVALAVPLSSQGNRCCSDPQVWPQVQSQLTFSLPLRPPAQIRSPPRGHTPEEWKPEVQCWLEMCLGFNQSSWLGCVGPVRAVPGGSTSSCQTLVRLPRPRLPAGSLLRAPWRIRPG